jgi:menaquinol-cytochrome c reductase iron-sulfur subunit
MIDRREFHRWGTFVIGGLMGMALAVPGVAYILDPLRRKSAASGFLPLARLGELKVGVPRSFPITQARQDAWVKYPAEPVGAIWVVRQPAEAKEPVVAFSSKCPHAGCPVDLAADGRSFQCPCHKSSFTLQGQPTNDVPPRAMDTLEVELADPKDPNSEVRVKYQVFRTQTKEKTPLV